MFCDVAGGACTQSALGVERFFVHREDEYRHSDGEGLYALDQLQSAGPFQSDVYYRQIRRSVPNQLDCILSRISFSSYFHIRLMIDELSKALSKQWMVIHNDDSYFVVTHEVLKIESSPEFPTFSMDRCRFGPCVTSRDPTLDAVGTRSCAIRRGMSKKRATQYLTCPSELVHDTILNYFRRFSQAEVERFWRPLWRWLISRLPKVEKGFSLDLDSTIFSRHGTQQQGAARGYNPRRPGRLSHHPLLAVAKLKT